MAFRSLTTRLIFWTLLAGGGVFAATLVASNQLARRSAVAAAELEARQAADRLADRVRTVLVAVEESAQLLAASLETVEPDARAVERLLRRFVATGRHVSGSAAAYAPEAARGSGPPPRRSSPVRLRRGRPTRQAALRRPGAAKGGYEQQPWYAARPPRGSPRGPSRTSTR